MLHQVRGRRGEIGFVATGQRLNRSRPQVEKNDAKNDGRSVRTQPTSREHEMSPKAGQDADEEQHKHYCPYVWPLEDQREQQKDTHDAKERDVLGANAT